jgi:ppGpp synthetase/RelA/SpoT-type nucleotidyltranferase
MAFSKSEVNRAGQVITENRPLTAPGEIDRLGAAIDVVDWWRSEHAAPLNAVAANLRYYAAEVGDPVVAQRLKRLPTIGEKLVRLPKMKLATMGDIGGVRAVVANQAAAYHVTNRLRKNWTITRFSDYVADPKPDGYRALHLMNRHGGRLIEIQIRTRLQDEWANLVEMLTGTAFPGLKFGNGPSRLHELLIDLSSANAKLEVGASSVDPITEKLQEIVAWTSTFLEEQRNEP